MKYKRSIQKRVFAIFGGFTLIVAFGYSVASIIVAYIIEDEVLNRLVAIEVERIQNKFKQTGEIDPSSAQYFKVYEQINLAPSEIAVVARKNSMGEVFSASGRHYHIRKLHLEFHSQRYKNAILVADVTDLLAVRNLPTDIVAFILLLFCLSIIIALGGALIITRHTTKPIIALTNRVMKRSLGNQSKNRKSSSLIIQANDEVDYLSLTIERAVQQLQTAIERESQFNRDVSHELRTPLTEILNTLALSKQQGLSAAEVSQLNHFTNNIKNIVTTLLALARAETAIKESFSMQALIEECVLGLYTKIAENNFMVECNLAALAVTGNRQMAGLAINNLIDNAINHSSKPSLTITISEQTIHFDNTFLNEIPTDLTHPNNRHSKSEGIGQGLYLVKRALEAIDWQYCVNASGATYRFSIFPTIHPSCE